VSDWSPKRRFIGDSHEDTIPVRPAADEPLKPADVLYDVVCPDVLSTLVLKFESLAADVTRPSGSQVLQLDRSVSVQVTTTEEKVQPDAWLRMSLKPHPQLPVFAMRLPREGVLEVCLGMKDGSALRKPPQQSTQVNASRDRGHASSSRCTPRRGTGYEKGR
jgi:hypothetical protein